MSFTDLASIGAIIGTAISCVLIFVQIARKMEHDMNRKFDAVWRRFDEHKDYTGRQIEAQEIRIQSTYLRQDIYNNNHKALRDLLSEQLKNIVSEIRAVKENCRYCTGGHSDSHSGRQDS